MLQRLSTLSGGLRAVGGPRALPALARQVRLYGFGSHVNDNGERALLRGANPSRPAGSPVTLAPLQPRLADPEVMIGDADRRSEASGVLAGQLPLVCAPACKTPEALTYSMGPRSRRRWIGRCSGTSRVRPGPLPPPSTAAARAAPPPLMPCQYATTDPFLPCCRPDHLSHQAGAGLERAAGIRLGGGGEGGARGEAAGRSPAERTGVLGQATRMRRAA